jgi:2-hydroxychromene-2-carboxylate isomerase
MWEDGVDVSKPDLLSRVLSKRFPEADVKAILEKANSAPYKQRLNDNTKEALDRGAFGCPWFFVRNSKGEEEPFFGSDRYVLPASTILLWPQSCFGGRPAFSIVPVTDGKVFETARER